jgi:hypothetical protein
MVDKLLYWKIQNMPDREVDKRLELILEGKMDKEILIFGSSRAQHNLYADIIQDSLKQSAFNLGYRGCNIDFQVFLLKTLLKHNKKPKIIILTVDDDREFLKEKTLQFRYDKLYSLVKYQEITNELIFRKEISPFAVGLFSARIGWEQFLKPKAITRYENWTKGGTVLLDFTAADFDKKIKQSKKYNQKLELAERLAAFAEFQSFCKKENIQLYVVVPPNFAMRNEVFINRVKGLLVDKKTEFYSENSPLFKDSNYFSDPSHLNKVGAIEYTNQIINKLKVKLNTKPINP